MKRDNGSAGAGCRPGLSRKQKPQDPAEARPWSYSVEWVLPWGCLWPRRRWLSLLYSAGSADAGAGPFLGPVATPACQPGDRTEQGAEMASSVPRCRSAPASAPIDKPFQRNLAIVGEYAGQGAGHQLMWYGHCAYMPTEGFDAGQNGVPPLLHPGIQVLDVSSQSDPRNTVTNLDDPASLYDWADGAVNSGRRPCWETAESWERDPAAAARSPSMICRTARIRGFLPACSCRMRICWPMPAISRTTARCISDLPGSWRMPIATRHRPDRPDASAGARRLALSRWRGRRCRGSPAMPPDLPQPVHRRRTSARHASLLRGRRSDGTSRCVQLGQRSGHL